MRILLLGGTGVIGTSVSRTLKDEHDVYVTSRSKSEFTDGISYTKLNAKNTEEVLPILQQSWDVIIDFLVYSTEEFTRNLPLLLKNTKHYIFISSCRIFTPSETPINESSPRLLDTSKDRNFLNSDEYAITKARQENLIFSAHLSNWSIVRPYITFGPNRLQLGLYEKEEWLHRALRGHSLVVSRELLNRTTTITPANLVSRALVKIANSPTPLHDGVNVVSDDAYRWSDVVDAANEAFEECGLQPIKLCIVSDKEFEKFQKRRYQAVYDRLHNRHFDNNYFTTLMGSTSSSGSPLSAYKEHVKEFISCGQFGYIDLLQEAQKDRVSSEIASYRAFSRHRMFAKYLYFRFLS